MIWEARPHRRSRFFQMIATNAPMTTTRKTTSNAEFRIIAESSMPESGHLSAISLEERWGHPRIPLDSDQSLLSQNGEARRQGRLQSPGSIICYLA